MEGLSVFITVAARHLERFLALVRGRAHQAAAGGSLGGSPEPPYLLCL